MYHYYHYNPMGFSNTGAVIKVIAESTAETKLKYPHFVRISCRLAEQLAHTGADKIPEVYMNRDKIPEVYMNRDSEPIWRYNDEETRGGEFIW